jgi:hypothetical protein
MRHLTLENKQSYDTEPGDQLQRQQHGHRRAHPRVVRGEVRFVLLVLQRPDRGGARPQRDDAGRLRRTMSVSADNTK